MQTNTKQHYFALQNKPNQKTIHCIGDVRAHQSHKLYFFPFTKMSGANILKIGGDGEEKNTLVYSAYRLAFSELLSVFVCVCVFVVE